MMSSLVLDENPKPSEKCLCVLKIEFGLMLILKKRSSMF